MNDLIPNNSNWFSSLDKLFSRWGEQEEARARRCKKFFQYKYFTIPVYKILAKKVGSVAATGLTYLAAHLVIHIPAAKLVGCYLAIPINSLELFNSCLFSTTQTVNLFFLLSTVYWFSESVPVMYVKYKREYSTIKLN